MKTNWWPCFKASFHRNFMDFLKIFATEDEFINKHKRKSSMISEQERYGKDDGKKNDPN
ncbi:hypothetical protein [Limosilactobacillus oris]|uniref:hypothetical protein n=1 Tax=Limosilactobacillus oris TaxID=1632 RepID=UPI0025986E08|nr:hypothetical protein [Limosilactobacillus oris]